MDIVFVTPELAPVAKVGGLADVAASLPRALERLGHRVFVLVPRYRGIGGLRSTGVELRVEMDGKVRSATISKARLNGTETFFIENDDYFSGRAIYGEGGPDYPDNAFRFAFFSRAVVPAVRALGLEPSLYHVHDWQTALLSIYQRIDSGGLRLPVVLTVHNLAYQGVYPRELLPWLGLPDELFHMDGLEFYGRLNFLKGGLVTADRITTVSPTYAHEIQTEDEGAGLEGVVRSRSDLLTGILNGIEPADWDPEKDEALVTSYASNRLAGKKVNKLALQKELGLEASPRIPLLAVVGRLDPQKGFDLLLEATPLLLSEGRAQLVVLGSGREELLDAFKKLQQSHPKSLSVNRGFQDTLGRRIYAGADLFLMPSRYEPCGLGQMIALRYGTLPVVRVTGGLADTVRDLDRDPERGNGFAFDDFNVAGLVDAVSRALGHYEDATKWKKWVRRAMREDFSWEASAKQYSEVYEELTP